MKSMNKADFRQLTNMQNNIKITMYLPVAAGPQNTLTNVSLLRRAEALLNKTFKEEGVGNSEKLAIRKALKPIVQKLEHSAKGKTTAIFITDNYSAMVYSLDFTVNPSIYYDLRQVQLEPLAEHFKNSTKYWLLAISQSGCRLFEGAGSTIKDVSNKSLQKDLWTTLRLDEQESGAIQTHQIRQGGQKNSEAVHGHGGYKDKSKMYLEKYLRLIEDNVKNYNLGKDSPIILTGSQYAQSAYKRMSGQQNIFTTKINFNPTALSASKIKEITEPILGTNYSGATATT